MKNQMIWYMFTSLVDFHYKLNVFVSQILETGQASVSLMQ